MNRLITFILTIICSLGIQAQNQKFLDGLRANETGKGTVTVTQSPAIDVLVNGNPQPSANNGVTNPTPAVPHTITSIPQENNRPDATQHTGTDIANNNSETPGEDAAVDTRKKVMRNSYKTTGFRIQVFSGGNVYVHFYSPSWKCRMGNYRTQEEARAVLAQVKKYYPQACLVKGTISVQY